MDFLDQIGKKLNDVGQSVSQSTKNFSDLARLNGAVSAKQKQITQLYSTLGQAYYERHKDEDAPEESELIGQLKALHAEIARLSEEIRQIKSAGKCPSCGAAIAAGAAFCTACGAKLPTQEPPEGGRTCPSCGALAVSDNKFCTVCGTVLE